MMRISMIRRSEHLMTQITSGTAFSAAVSSDGGEPDGVFDRDLEYVVARPARFHEAGSASINSAGSRSSASPEIFIRSPPSGPNHRFGTGVISLPYHNPLMVADRIVQLDHHTRAGSCSAPGRGSCLRRADARIDPMTSATGWPRDRRDPAALPRQTVTEKDRLYTLVNARLHLPPYTKPYPDGVVVPSPPPAAASPENTISAMIWRRRDNPFGYDALAATGRSPCDIAAEHGREMDPARLGLVGPMHIAETREKAFANRPFRVRAILNYLNNNQRRFVVPAGEDPLEWLSRTSTAWSARRMMRSHDRAAAGEAGRVRRLPATGPQLGDWEETKRSYELYARYVTPHFSRQPARAPTRTTGAEHRDELSEKRATAARAMFDKHEAEQRAAIHRPARGREAW